MTYHVKSVLEILESSPAQPNASISTASNGLSCCTLFNCGRFALPVSAARFFGTVALPACGAASVVAGALLDPAAVEGILADRVLALSAVMPEPYALLLTSLPQPPITPCTRRTAEKAQLRIRSAVCPRLQSPHVHSLS